MKFKDMPYKRVEYEEAEKEYRRIIEAFQSARSGEEQFEIHKKKHIEFRAELKQIRAVREHGRQNLKKHKEREE